MAQTPRMQQLEALLQDDPQDPFLRYGLAMEHSSQGDDAQAIRVLEELIESTEKTEPYVPAYLQCGQAHMRLGQDTQAIAVLRVGCEMARKMNNQHALGEMQGLLSTLE